MIKKVIYEFRYDYVKPKYAEKAKLRYVDIDIDEDSETRFDT